jgi:putative transcription antitermination factor YqgF
MKILPIQEFRKHLLRFTNPTASLIGLDIGTKHVGVAIHPLHTNQFHPVVTLTFDSTKEISSDLQSVIEKYYAVGIVSGLPLYDNGQPTRLAHCIIPLMQNTKCFFPKEIQIIGKDLSLSQNDHMVCTFWDERNSTVDARAKIKHYSEKFKVVKKYKDSMAAVVILESFVDSVL